MRLLCAVRWLRAIGLLRAISRSSHDTIRTLLVAALRLASLMLAALILGSTVVREVQQKYDSEQDRKQLVHFEVPGE